MAVLCPRTPSRGGTATRSASGKATRWWWNRIKFRDLGWLDVEGSPLTETGKIIERFRRPDFGHLEIEVTIDDPKAYTKPWTVTVYQRLMLDTDLIEFVCQENDKDDPKTGPHLRKVEKGWRHAVADALLVNTPSRIAWQTYSCNSHPGASVNDRVNEYGLVNAFASSIVSSTFRCPRSGRL